jgi:type IV secretion system protein VirB9
MTTKAVASFLVALLCSASALLAAASETQPDESIAPPPPTVTSAVPDLPGLPSPAALRAAEAYDAGRPAASIVGGPALEVPFGHLPTPTLTCAPLRACAVELEAGELVLTTATGDGSRWLIDVAAAGPGGSTPLVVVKPTECDLSTNLLVATDRRIYELRLDAPPCPGSAGDYNPQLAYTSRLRFYYPDQLVRRWRAAAVETSEEVERLQASEIPLTAPLTRLNFGYAWRRGHRWAPEQVFDDGRRTYVRMPRSARNQPAPALFSLDAKGATSLLNYSLDGDWYVVDRVVERLALVLSEGSRRGRRLVITNRTRGRR